MTATDRAGRRIAAPPSLHRMSTARDLRLQKTVTPFLGDIPAWGAAYAPQQPATKALKALIEANAWAAAFGDAIARVADQGVPELSLIRSLDQFYYFIDSLVVWIPEIRVWEDDGKVVHERTVYLRICQLYYYFNQPELEALQSPIAPCKGEDLTPLSLWLRDFAVDWGAFLDTPPSAAKLAGFKLAPEYAWQDYEKPPEAYATFNEFFARTFKDMDVQRPVAQPGDDRVICFPAESTFVGQWAISTAAPPPLPAPPAITVKHIRWPIEELLDGSVHAKDFEGGLFCHSFLNTYDYHRLHAPVSGKVVEARFIPGQVYLQVGLKSQRAGPEASSDLANAVVPQRYLDADDNTGYQFVQCRGLLVLETPNLGKVAVLPMGMAQVSSVVFVDPGHGNAPVTLSAEERAGKSYAEQVALLNRKVCDALVGREMKKGDMFSFFQFGGSDCVMVFERGANVSVTAQPGVHYPIRSRYAEAQY